jgi:hypothetical protein
MVLMKSFQGVCAKWRRKTQAERLDLMEAFALLGVARFLILVMPFRWLATSLGRRMNESSAQTSASDLNHARRIGRAVRTAANYTPWESVCLPQAVAAQWMLKRRHIAGTLYLGLAKDKEKPGELSAHAWLRCGAIIIVGAQEYRRFKVVAAFS